MVDSCLGDILSHSEAIFMMYSSCSRCLAGTKALSTSIEPLHRTSEALIDLNNRPSRYGIGIPGNSRIGSSSPALN